MEDMKLKQREIKSYREQQLIQQNNKCGLCGEDLPLEEAVLDHDHKTGALRRVVHRNCNIMLGKIENAMVFNRIDLGRLSKIANNLIGYIVADPCSEMLHPTYRTDEEKALLRKKRAKARRKKKITI